MIPDGPFQCYKLGSAVSDLSQCAFSGGYHLGHSFVKKNKTNGIQFNNTKIICFGIKYRNNV